MIYIKRIHLENFQSHKLTDMTFDKGLNVIIGNSDSGKTAILRAIKWALYNEPQGDYFIRQGEAKVVVEIEFSNGVVVRRLKSSSKNLYYLKTGEGEEYQFEGFRNEVPREVSEATGMYKVDFSSSNLGILNISEQLEGPFLLNESSSVRANAIGRLVSVNYIDDALRQTVRDDKSTLSKINDLEKTKKNLEEMIKEFDYLEDLEKKLKALDKLRIEIKNKSKELDLLKFYDQNLNKINYEMDREKESFRCLPDIEVLSNIYGKLLANISYYSLYENLFTKINKTGEDILKTEAYLKHFINNESLKEIYLNLKDNLLKLRINKDLFEKLMANEKEINECKFILKDLNNIYPQEKNLKDLEKKIIILKTYSDLNVRFLHIEKSIQIGENYVKSFDSLNDLNINVATIGQKTENLKVLRTLYNSYEGLNSNIELLNKEISGINKDIGSLTEDYERVILKAGICPFCYSKINEESLKHIKSHLEGD